MFPRHLASIGSLILLTTLFFFFINRSAYVPRSSASRHGANLDTVVVYKNASAADNNATAVEPVVLTMVLMGAAVAREGLVTIKSALMHASRPLVFHLICSEDAVPVVESRIALIKRPYYSLDVVYHVLTVDRVRQRLERARVGTNWPLLTKVLIHEILADVKRAAYVDTDMIFVVDPAQLWDTFPTLGKDVLISFPTLGNESHAGQICTCVMLMELARMRNPDVLLIPSTRLPDVSDWLSEPVAAAKKDGIRSIFNKPDERMPFDPMDLLFGDQGLYYVLWLYRPYLFDRLSLRWDVTGCRESYGLRMGHFKEGEHPEDMSEVEQLAKQGYNSATDEGLLFPGILHFNCQPEAGSNVWEWHENHEPQKTWAPIVSSTVLYKWIWLNRGDGSAKVTSRKVVGVTWLDEMGNADWEVKY